MPDRIRTRVRAGILAAVLGTAIGLAGLPANRLHAAACPAVTVTNDMGITGNFPQQFELSEFESVMNCKLTFSENPAISALNDRIVGNPPAPPLADRLPAEPLVVAPYFEIGTYGGTLDMISNALEAGTSDLLSVRHVNLVRFSDDLATIVPNIAKGWSWNDDFTQLTFFLRKGHKWSNGDPFTAADVKFWYDDLNMDTNVIEKPKDYLLVAGERMTVDVIDDQTVRFNLPAPKPGLLAHFASHYGQGFQSKKFLGQFHPAINSDADKLAQAAGFENGYEVVNLYYGQSDWTDTPTPLLRYPDRIKDLPAAVMPSLESYVTIAESTEGRHYVANPYFHMVDTAGNQLPYIDQQDETMVDDNEVRILKMINGEIDYKTQSLALPMMPVLMDNAEKGNFSVDLRPEIALPVFAINVTHADLDTRAVFGDLKFRQAMSVAMNRDEINEVVYFGLGTAQQFVPFSPAPDFVSEEMKQYYAQYDPDLAKKLLDEIGVVDKDGDGARDLPNGKKLVINIQFATQGIDSTVVELVAQHWTNVGIETIAEEITPDEYRSAQSANQLDVTFWRTGTPLAIVLGNAEAFLPPYGGYFGVRNGMLWAEYVDSDGANGVKPPDYVYELIEDIGKFQSTLAGTPESDAIGARMVKNHTGNLLFIGTVLAPAPIYHSNALKNFSVFKTASYEHFRTYPYRPQQWFFSDSRQHTPLRYKRGVYWNSWMAYTGGRDVDAIDAKKPNPYAISLDLSPYDYRSFLIDQRGLGSFPAESSLQELLQSYPEEQSLRFIVLAVPMNDTLEFLNETTAELKIDLDTFRDNIEHDLVAESATISSFLRAEPENKDLQDLSSALNAGLVSFEVSPRAGSEGQCGLVAFSIWDHNSLMPLDYLVLTVPIVATDGSVPNCVSQPGSTALGGAESMLATNLIHMSDPTRAADAAFHVFETVDSDDAIRTVVAFVDGTASEPKITAWRTFTALSNYIRTDLQTDIMASRFYATRGQPYPYEFAANNLRQIIFTGVDFRNCDKLTGCPAHDAAMEAEMALRALAASPDMTVVARMTSSTNRSLYVPLGLLAADAAEAILKYPVTFVQPLPIEKYFAKEDACIGSWTFAVPKILDGVGEAGIINALSKLEEWADTTYRWLRDQSLLKAYFADSVVAATGAGSEGLVVLAHHDNGNFYYEQSLYQQRIKAVDRQHSFPDGSVAFLAACSVADTGLTSSNDLIKEFNEQGIHAIIASPFAVSADFGAQFAIDFLDVVNASRQAGENPTLKTLFNAAIEKTAEKIAQLAGGADPNITESLKEMALEFIILGDHTLRLCRKR